MILRAVGRAIYWTLGALQAAGECVGASRRLIRQVRSGSVPHADPGLDDTDPVPLTRPNGERLAEPAPRSMRASGMIRLPPRR